MPTAITAPCLKCKAEGTIETRKNLLGEQVSVVACKKCGSSSVSKDGLHWNLVIENNEQKAA